MCNGRYKGQSQFSTFFVLRPNKKCCRPFFLLNIHYDWVVYRILIVKEESPAIAARQSTFTFAFCLGGSSC